jgi:hypothetical protein
MSVQPQAPATLSGKKTRFSLDRRLDGTQSQFGRGDQDKNPCREDEQGHSFLLTTLFPIHVPSIAVRDKVSHQFNTSKITVLHFLISTTSYKRQTTINGSKVNSAKNAYAPPSIPSSTSMNFFLEY